MREAPCRQFEPDAIDSFECVTFLIGETLTLRLGARIGQEAGAQLPVGVEPRKKGLELRCHGSAPAA